MKDDWRSYGPVASAYACVAGPAYFARPAADLVSLLGLAPKMSLLDVGTGSGVVLVAAVAAVGAQARIRL